MTSSIGGIQNQSKIKAKIGIGPGKITSSAKTPHITSVQYCEGCSVQWGDCFRTVGDNFSTVGVA